MSSSFDIAAFKSKIETESDKLTHIIRAAHKHRITDDEITQAAEFLLKDAERKPSGECLQKAACFGYIKLAKLLLEKGVNVNTRDRNKNTPLINAAHTKHSEVARYLVESGAYINARNRYKWSALKYACLNNDKELAKYLIEHEASTEIITTRARSNIINKLHLRDNDKYAGMMHYLQKVNHSLTKRKHHRRQSDME